MFLVKKLIALILLYLWFTGIVRNKKNRDIFITSVRIMLSGENLGVGIGAIFVLVGIPIMALALLFF